MILGIDEAGRGPWAGPLVVGAVVLGGAVIDGLTDSKLLSKKKREALYASIIECADATATGWVGAAELDELGMSEALRVATRRAVEQITVPYHEIIIDGKVNFLAETSKGDYVTTLTKADLLVPSVSAASIIAKVERDRYMEHIDATYPLYGFRKHAGYGVASHRAAIATHGVTPEHRLSFAPLAAYRGSTMMVDGNTSHQDTLRGHTKATTRSVGLQSEAVVAQELVLRGHDIIERNWRTRWCEIDIISKMEDTLYFTEVKHRSRASSESGIDAITPAKHRQMKFAAQLYGASRPHVTLRLIAAATHGTQPRIDRIIELD